MTLQYVREQMELRTNGTFSENNATIYSRKNGTSNKWNFGAKRLATKKQNGTWVRVIDNTYRNQQSTVLVIFLGAFPSFVTIFSARFQRIYGHESLRS